MKPESTQQERSEGVPYEAPAIVYEGQISTRAGTPIPESADPADLFGNVE